MSKVRIIVDSAADIIGWHKGRDDIRVLPMLISFGEEEYYDGVTIDHATFYNKLIESDELPVTSLVPPTRFEEAYKEGIQEGYKMVVLTVSSKLSGTCQSAMLAAQDYEGQVFVVDTENAAIGEQVLVLYALRLVEQGMEAEAIAEELNKAKKKVRILALLDTLEYLKKGGRISKTVAFVGGTLSIKPVVTVRDGVVEMIGKARGSKNGNNLLIQEVDKANGIDFDMPFLLGYTGNEDSLLQKYIADSKALWEGVTEELPISGIGATVGTHIGPGAIAVAFFANED